MTTTPAADWGGIDLGVGRTYEYIFDLYEGDAETPLVIEASDLLRFFLWDTDDENPSDMNINSGTETDAFTTDFATNNKLTTDASSHHLDNGAVVTVSSSGTLPAGLTAGTTYYVINRDQTTFEVSTSRGGSAVTLTSDGSGTHTWKKASTITVNTVGVANTTPAQVTVKFDQLDTQGLTADIDYNGELCLVDDDDDDKLKTIVRGTVSTLGTGGGETGLV